jgi:hypothetical protein
MNIVLTDIHGHFYNMSFYNLFSNNPIVLMMMTVQDSDQRLLSREALECF